ncbi:BICD family-like cargo adapter 2 [Rhinatrema bivittatum]|uniref:BICD family-like cargo adapter 2 n=1 Tax=Rhinatrema bivittatum TaxID=194408 RepID=UPI00112E4A7D|nr:BICD family-like cargo adapter 2 [Rhinatrema bivittatum]
MTSMKTDYLSNDDLHVFTKSRRENFRKTGMISPSMEEHFYPFILERQDSYTADVVGTVKEEEEEDLGLLLQKKEKDLLLAAELGKALLERNEELGRKNESLVVEFTEKMERLEQEKHELRLKLEAREREMESHVAELENDLASLREQLQHQRWEQQDTSREKSHAVRELAEQNQRLVEQLSQASQAEQRLMTELHTLREESRVKNLTSTENTARLQSLQAENSMLQERRQDLEQQIWLLKEENENSQALIDSLQDNSLLLRKQNHERNLQLQQVQSEAEELRVSNRHLQLKVKEMSDELHLHDANSSITSIQSEIEQTMDSEMEHQGTLKAFRSDDSMSTTEELAQKPTLPMQPDQAILQKGKEDIHVTQMSSPELDVHQKQKVVYLTQREQELLKEKEEEINRLHDQVTLQHVELANLKDELEKLRQLCQQSDRDSALTQAITDRDEAITKKNEMELELTKCCLERDSMSRQLLRTIQQKVTLSQELEAWQDDIQIMLNQQLQSQQQQEQSKSLESSPTRDLRNRRSRRNFSFRFKDEMDSSKDGKGFFSFFKKS